MNVYFMVGIPGSGKSTWIHNNLPGCTIVSTDAIREELFGNAEISGGGRVFELAYKRVLDALRDGRDVVFDATNLNPGARKRLLDRLRASGMAYRAVAVVLEVSPATALEYQKARARKVPEAVVHMLHRTYVPPSPEEGFAEVIFVNPFVRFLQNVRDWAGSKNDIRGILLVGSYARGTQRPDSDVDLVILAQSPDLYLKDPSFVRRFGAVERTTVEDWGRVKSLRVFYRDGLEVEFGLARPDWAKKPLDAGTEKVLADGARVILDRDGLLVDLPDWPMEPRP